MEGLANESTSSAVDLLPQSSTVRHQNFKSSKVHPKSLNENVHQNSEVVEVRPNRHLRICRIYDSETKDSDSPNTLTVVGDNVMNHQRSRTAASIELETNIVDRESRCSNISAASESQNSEFAIFFIHGVGGEIEVWNSQIEFFRKRGYAIIAFDLIGHGSSSAPPDPSQYTFDEMSKDVIAIFDRYHKRKNIIIGHSYGSCFAALLARQRSPHISNLIMISSGAPLALDPQGSVFCLPLCLLICCRPVLQEAFLRRSFYKLCKRNKVGYGPTMRTPTFVIRNTMIGQQWEEGNVEFHYWIAIPTLLIHGKHDKLVSIEDATLMQETIPDSRLVIVDDSSHMVMMEQEIVVNNLINNFLMPSKSGQPVAGNMTKH